jgi:hypothetical protein
MATVRAAEVAKRRLLIASRRLGTPDPGAIIGDLLDRSFDLPVGDPRYGQNELTPGYIPIEHSFSEMAGNALRLDMEPLGPGASPHARQQEAGREMRRIVNTAFGAGALRWFDERSEPWRGSRLHGNARFGAWFGMGVDPAGVQEAKVYYELRPGDITGLPPNLQHAARVAMGCLPGLVPIFTSIACGRQKGAQRLYFFHRGDLRLLDLEPLLHRLGIGSQLPGLLAAAGVVLGGRFVLPEGSVILGLRDTDKGIEMKLDVLIAGMPDPPPQMFDLLNMALAERPRSQHQLRRWVQAMTPDDEWERGPGGISVVSFRAQPQQGTRCSLYIRPNGYTQEGRRAASPGATRGATAGAPAQSAYADPYRA